ncbi:DUF397 domain-containing protein [Actinomadura fibrosa]|uniref:DUF397 domain-containing protein n=1 Tax=Actinomadura fibrosa TaxID=111802 RepID=A0ABW2Y187_9ACTN|nr:DUF397 domain-containing protein [Actinomadura fibrosa]
MSTIASRNADDHAATAPVWRKSSRSMPGGDCVEAARSPGQVLVRDSKDTAGPVLAFGGAGWQRFLADVELGRYDL